MPYRNAAGEVAYGTLVSDLLLQGDATAPPTNDHVARLIGDPPYGTDGAPMEKLILDQSPQQIEDGLATNVSFSRKVYENGTARDYVDYYEKVITYIGDISAPAVALDESATAIAHPVVPDEDADSVFNYIDTATARAGISAASEKLRVEKIAIVGLGGSGSYILDYLAKTPVKEIHLYDGDGFYQHNAFRSPGGPSNRFGGQALEG